MYDIWAKSTEIFLPKKEDGKVLNHSANLIVAEK